MKKPKVYENRAFSMDKLIYVGGPMTGKSEVAFINEASNQGIKHFLGDSVYHVTGKPVPGIATNTIYGQIIPNDGSDSFRKFCEENINVVTHCIRDEKMIFPFLDVSINDLYTISLCGKDLCNRVVAHNEITSYVAGASGVFRFNRLVFSPEHRSQSKYISMEAICDDIVVEARNPEVVSAIKINLAAQIRYEILQDIYMRCDYSDTMQIYQVVDSLLITLTQMSKVCHGGAFDEDVSNKANDIIAKIMSDCTAVRFVDEYATCEDVTGAYADYSILEAEKIAPETLKAVGELFAEYAELLPGKTDTAPTSGKELSKTKSEVKAVKKKTTTTTAGSRAKKNTTKAKATEEKKPATTKTEGEIRNGKEEK